MTTGTGYAAQRAEARRRTRVTLACAGFGIVAPYASALVLAAQGSVEHAVRVFFGGLALAFLATFVVMKRSFRPRTNHDILGKAVGTTLAGWFLGASPLFVWIASTFPTT